MFIFGNRRDLFICLTSPPPHLRLLAVCCRACLLPLFLGPCLCVLAHVPSTRGVNAPHESGDLKGAFGAKRFSTFRSSRCLVSTGLPWLGLLSGLGLTRRSSTGANHKCGGRCWCWGAGCSGVVGRWVKFTAPAGWLQRGCPQCSERSQLTAAWAAIHRRLAVTTVPKAAASALTAGLGFFFCFFEGGCFV